MNDQVRLHLSREAKRKIYSAMIVAVIVVLTLGQPHAGFLLLALLLPLSVWLTWSAWVIIRRPYARLAQIICVLVWVVAIGLLAGIHFIWHEVARRDADQIARAVDDFTGKYGRCPQYLDQVGFKRDIVAEKLGANYVYVCSGGKPKLSYVATFAIFSTFDYDFDRDIWKYESWADKKQFMDTSQGAPSEVAAAARSPASVTPPPGTARTTHKGLPTRQ